MTAPKLKPLKPSPADQPATASEAQIQALQALYDGKANTHQQQLAMAWIINEASGAHKPAYRAGSDGQRDTDFSLGRAFVGQQIIGLLKVNLIALQEKES